MMAGLFVFLVLLPDFVYECIYPQVRYLTDFLFILVIGVFGFFLSVSGVAVYVVCCLLFMFMQLIQLAHIAYFFRPINPLDISKVFEEFADIYSTSLSDVDDFWHVGLLAVVPFLILIFLEIKWRKKLYFSFVGILAVIIFLSVKPERAMRRGLNHFLPPETRYSMHNSVNSFSFWLVREVFMKSGKNARDIIPENFYKPYRMTEISEGADLVVLVMGESTSAAKMHIFRPEIRQTTPQLEKFAENNRLFYREAISGAVSTHSSLPIFFNMMKEPGNVRKLFDHDTNLFRMAKQHGYRTYFFSAYDMKQTNLIGTPYIDEIITSEYNPRRFKRRKEDLLVKMFKKLNLHEGKNFVVLNFKSVHSPYEENYAHHPEFDVFKPRDDSRFEEENAAYENAVLYIDSILTQLLEYFKSLNIRNSHFVFTSDHAEMLGIPDGRYGHNQLIKESAAVPFIWYHVGGLEPDMPKGRIAHYEISKWLAEWLGYKIENPNYGDEVFFVHGNNLFNDYEFVEMHRNFDGSVTKIRQETLETLVKHGVKDGK